MKTTMQLKLSTGKITEVKLRKDGSYEFVVDSEQPVDATLEVIPKIKSLDEDTFVLIEASKLSLKDEFMQYEPLTENQKKFKRLLAGVIESGVKDFWRPRLDPSFDKDKSGIVYVAGQKPAVRKSYNWWENTAKGYNPQHKSRLGTKSEYVAFLGVLIKLLVSEGWTVAEAWNAVCHNSKYLGHYRNSMNAKRDFEPTGSRKICGFFDLANTYKILAEDEEAGGFWLAGGCFDCDSDVNPLADLYRDDYQNYGNLNSVGWLVL